MNFRLKDLPKHNRPRERFKMYGAQNLTDIELLSILLGSGIKDDNIINVSMKVFSKSKGLRNLFDMSLNELQEIKGIGEVKSIQILALGELIRRYTIVDYEDKLKISSAIDCVNIINNEMSLLNKEVLKIIMLNVKNIVIGIRDVSIGSLNSSIVHPREVFYEAIKNSSASIIIAHNHPSGDSTPSREDINITKRLKECGELLGINLLDHIIIGKNTYVSLKEKGIL